MTCRLFIDECLSPSLVTLANQAGYEASCARNRGFNRVLTELSACDDLINTAMELFELEDGACFVIKYAIPVA